MTALQRQRAIAQWHREQVGKRLRVFVDDDGCEQEGMLDYLHDLNAMHEAERNDANRAGPNALSYERELRRVCRGNPIWHASAAQRAEALLRTIGRWVDK